MQIWLYICRMKLRNLFYSVVLICCFLLVIYQAQINYWETDVNNLPKILWWTPFTLRDDLEVIYCGDYKCAVTDNRSYTKDVKAFLFYGSNFKPYDVPLPRNSQHIWAILHEESPKNLALFLHDDGLELFNFSSTFSRHSDVPLTLQYLPSLESLTGLEYYVASNTKDSYLDTIAPILYVQSDCQTPLERDSYVSELMNYINVDAYGKCLNNKEMPKKFTENPLEDLYATDFMHFVGQYKFVISFENAICEDYITEKLWRPLIVGAVPIYLGSPSVQDYLPNGEKSAILAQNFDSPKALAEYLHELNNNKHLYENYLQHKLSDYFKITNSNLTSMYNVIKYHSENHLFNEFECKICENIHLKKQKAGLDSKEYNCPVPVSPITRKENSSNWWAHHWHEGSCQAKYLKEIVNNNLNITKDMYDNKVMEMNRQNEC